MDKVDLLLDQLLSEREHGLADARARGDREAAERAEGVVDVHVAFAGGVDFFTTQGLPLYSLVPGLARGLITPAQIRAVAAMPEVHLVRLPEIPHLLVDRSVPEMGVPTAWGLGVGAADVHRGKGKGVVIGIIDSGIDVFHGAFRNNDASRTTRIVSVWDQTFLYNGAGAPVDTTQSLLIGAIQPRDENGAVLGPGRAPTARHARFTYGAEFNSAQINAALAAHPDGRNMPISLTDETEVGDDTYHGTHVTGIAAGNGAEKDRCTNAGVYRGVAPEADIVVVKTAVGVRPNQMSNVVDAAEYIFLVAATPTAEYPTGRPAVVSMSLGGHAGPHNGENAEALAFDALTSGAQSAGRAIVLSAGNYRHIDQHAAFTIARGTAQTVSVNLKSDKKTQFMLFASYNPGARLTCVVRAPGSGPVQQTPPQDVRLVNAAVAVGVHNVQVRLEASAPTDPDVHFFVTITRQAAGANVSEGVWQLDLTAAAAGTDANVHLWVVTPLYYDAVILPFAGAVPSPQDASRDIKRPAEWIAGTIGRFASCRNAISVAAYNAEESGTPLAEFSSQGPAPSALALGLYAPAAVIAKPDIAAPGVAINAPKGQARRCCLECECCVAKYVAEQGTSMAAPHIAGVIALMFAQDRTLTTASIKTRLLGNVRPPPPLPPGWPPSADLWGRGKVDAKAAVQAAVVRELTADVATETPPIEVVEEPAAVPVSLPDRLRAWNDVLGARPAWNLCAALVSLHFDEVKRLIDTNRRVGAVWQRHGGPALVRGLVFADAVPDPPIPAGVTTPASRELLARLWTVLLRFGGDALRADIVRYAPFAQALPGASWDELDALVRNGGFG